MLFGKFSCVVNVQILKIIQPSGHTTHHQSSLLNFVHPKYLRKSIYSNRIISRSYFNNLVKYTKKLNRQKNIYLNYLKLGNRFNELFVELQRRVFFPEDFSLTFLSPFHCKLGPLLQNIFVEKDNNDMGRLVGPRLTVKSD